MYRALALDRRMREQHLDTPDILVVEPPPDYTKLRRQKNHRYRFEEAEGYQRPPL